MTHNERLDGLDSIQLVNLQDIINKRLASIEKQEKKIVWRVYNQQMCEGNFREEDYLGAVDCLAQISANLWQNDHQRTPYDLNVSIEGERVPAEEYESWFE